MNVIHCITDPFYAQINTPEGIQAYYDDGRKFIIINRQYQNRMFGESTISKKDLEICKQDRDLHVHHGKNRDQVTVISYRNLTLSEKLSKWVMLDVRETIAHDDVDVWYAPGECHGLITEGFDREREELEKEIPFAELEKEVEERTGKPFNRMYEMCFGRSLFTHNPFN